MYAVRNSIFSVFLHQAHSNKLDKTILNIYRVWSFLPFIGFLPIEMAKMTKHYVYIESVRQAYSNELYGRNSLNIEVLTSYTLIIDHLYMYSVLCHLHKSNFLISNWLIIFLILDWIWTAITGLFYAQMQPEKSWQMIIMIFSLYSYLFSSLQYLLWSIAILLWHNHGSTDRPRIQGPSSTRRSGATFSKSQPQRSSRLAFFCSSKIILVIPFINFCLFIYF